MFLGLGLCTSWIGFVVQTSSTFGDAMIMVVAMIVLAPIAWFTYMWVTAEVVCHLRRRATDRSSGAP